MTQKISSIAAAALLALSLTVGGSRAEAGDFRDRFVSQNGKYGDSVGGYYGLGHGRQIGNRGIYGGPKRQNVPHENGDYSEALAKRFLPFANISVVKMPAVPTPTPSASATTPAEVVPSKTTPDSN